jgi:hypothetical protein
MRELNGLRLLIITAALSSHVLLSAVAFASPPDPVGQSGIFDDDDNDDVVLLVMAMAAVAPSPPPQARPIHPFVWLPLSREPGHSPAVPLYARQIRAPPAS